MTADPAADETWALLAALEASWPPEWRAAGKDGLVLRRDDPEAGRRTRSARLTEEPADPEAAAARLTAHFEGRGEPALLQAPALSAKTEAALRRRGFRPAAPTLLLRAKTADLARRPLSPNADPTLRVIEIRTRLAELDALWRRGGVGEARRRVMERALATQPGGVLAMRIGSRLKGGVFWSAQAGGPGFVHALHVAPEARRNGGASLLLRQAARAAEAAGSPLLAAAVEAANPARDFFRRLGFEPCGAYCYWERPLPR